MLLLGLRGLFCHRFAPNSILLFSVGNRLSKNRLCESTPRATGVSKRGAARSDFRAGMTTVARGASARVRVCDGITYTTARDDGVLCADPFPCVARARAL